MLTHTPGGPSNIQPGIFFFSTLAGTSTFIAQKFQNKEPKEKTSWMASKWSPMKQLTDQEYENILEERLLRLNAEIAVIDENIASLKGTTTKVTTAPPATAPSSRAASRRACSTTSGSTAATTRAWRRRSARGAPTQGCRPSRR